jgi:hypothetical protein
LIKEFTWILDKYDADGYYIIECYNKNKDNYVYVDTNACYYNKIK